MSQLQEVIAELRTINDMIRWAVSRFNEAEIYFGHGTTNAWDEAISLILPALHLNYEMPEAAFQARLTTSERLHLVSLITMRIEKRIPSAYLTHTMRFTHLDFYVNEHVLIPRSPMAELIEKHFSPWLDGHSDELRILDLCTGSACIAIACAHYLPDSIVDAVDISPEALVVAKKNVMKFQLEDRVNLFEGNLFDPLTPGVKYDLIISNPPYVDAADMAALPAEYRHEPALALEAGQDGLDVVKCILQKAKKYLKPQGVLIVEVGNSEVALLEAYPHLPFTWLEFERVDGGVFLLTYQDL